MVISQRKVSKREQATNTRASHPRIMERNKREKSAISGPGPPGGLTRVPTRECGEKSRGRDPQKGKRRVRQQKGWVEFRNGVFRDKKKKVEARLFRRLTGTKMENEYTSPELETTHGLSIEVRDLTPEPN